MKTIRILATVGVVWIGVAAGFGQATTKRAMTFADLMAMKRVSDPQVSPSGKWVMFSVTDVGLEKNTKVNHLWVVPLDGSAPERQVTSNTGESFGRFSPDGKFVSYTGEGTKDDPVARITIATWDEAAGMIGMGRTLKAVSGDADGAIWSPDSKHLLFTTDVYPECSDKPTWAEEDACDAAKDAAADKSPVKAQVWDALLYRHWDHYTGLKRSHIIEADFSLAGSSLDAKSDSVRDLTPASAVGDAETPTFFLGGVQNYAWAPDSKEIAYVTNLDAVPAASTNNDVFTLRLDEVGAKAVKVSTSLGSDDGPAYSPDGKWLAFRSQARAGFESDLFRLVLFDREKKTIKEVMPKFDGWVDEFAWGPTMIGLRSQLAFAGVRPSSNSNADAIYFTSGVNGVEPVYRLDLNAGPNTGRITRLTGRGEYSSVMIAENGLAIVSVGMTNEKPAEIFQMDRGGECVAAEGQSPIGSMGEANACFKDDLRGSPDGELTHQNDTTLAHLDLPKLENFWFIGAEGAKVEGFLIRPPGFDPAKKYPMKFLMHGGPQTAWGDSWSFRWNWELMAASGYVVVGINRRGSTGYGQKFVDEVSGDWGGRAYEDLMKGLDYTEAHYSFIDKTRECALGASYGGFMADWVLTHTNRFKCIVTHDGMYDPVAAYGSTEEMWFNEWEFRRPEDFPKGWDGFSAGYDPMGHPAKTNAGVPPLRPAASGRDDDHLGGGHAAEPWRYASLSADEDPFRRWSPMRFIENAKTPTLVIHSQRDYRLDVSQGMELFTALQRLGVPSKMLYFPDEGHWILKPQNAELWNAEVGDWCDRWTKTGKYAEGQ
jgi:dipeptidyl aminopeptidase/acylaminoacyl peptidase